MILFVHYSLDSVFNSQTFSIMVLTVIIRGCTHMVMQSLTKFCQQIWLIMVGATRPLRPTYPSQHPISVTGFSMVVVKL